MTSCSPEPSRPWFLTTQVDAEAGETIINGATVSTPGDDSEGDDNKGETDPTDVQGEGELVLEKSVSESVVEVGDLVRYELELRNVGLGPVLETVIQDSCHVGFSLVSGSVAIDGKAVSDPDGVAGPVLFFQVGDVAAGQTIRISYTLRVGVGADRGTARESRLRRISGRLPASNEASAAVQVELGVFSDLGHILGRVWVEVPDSVEFSSQEQEDHYDLPIGVPGVRVYLQDGTSAVTDQFGRYSFTDLRPRTWVVRVDERTLPVGVTLRPLTTRHMGDGVAKMVGLTMGEMARADFGDAEADTLLYQAVEDRAAMGPVPDVAVPNALGLRAGGSMTRGVAGPMSQRVGGTTIGGVGRVQDRRNGRDLSPEPGRVLAAVQAARIHLRNDAGSVGGSLRAEPLCHRPRAGVVLQVGRVSVPAVVPRVEDRGPTDADFRVHRGALRSAVSHGW